MGVFAALSGSINLHTKAKQTAQSLTIRCSKTRHAPELSSVEGTRFNLYNRRNVVGSLLGLSCLRLEFNEAKAAGLPPEEKPKLCDAACEKELENVGEITFPFYLEFYSFFCLFSMMQIDVFVWPAFADAYIVVIIERRRLIYIFRSLVFLLFFTTFYSDGSVLYLCQNLYDMLLP